MKDSTRLTRMLTVLALAPALMLMGYSCDRGDTYLLSLEYEVYGGNHLQGFNVNNRAYTLFNSSPTAVIRAQAREPDSIVTYQFFVDGASVDVGEIGEGGGEATVNVPSGASFLNIAVRAKGGVVGYYRVDINPPCSPGACDDGTSCSMDLCDTETSTCEFMFLVEGDVCDYSQAGADGLCGAGGICDGGCGNGVVDTALGEACDEGANNGTGDGFCLADCSGVQTCGNGIVEGDEECDDGNTIDGDRCSATCRDVEVGLCGNGRVESGTAEECDDGNNVDGDGCSATCEAECGCWNGGPDAFMGATSLTELFASTASMFSVATCNDLDECNETQARCEATDEVGDRTEIFVEVYDRGCEWRVRDDATGTDAEAAVSLTEAQGAACQRDLDALAETDTLMCGLSNPGGCGNGVLDAGEECDDGNDVNGDGCSTTCEVSFCGNGRVESGKAEECDDGNNVDGDGCSATCEAECGCWNGGPDSFMGAASLTELFASTASMFSVATCNDLDECNETQARCEATDAVGDRTEIFVEVYDRGCEWRVRDDATGTDAEAAVSLTEAQGAACQRDLDALAETDTLMCGLSNPGGCGNGVLDPGEECDDGNDVNGDGCSTTCEVSFCGNGRVERDSNEECDDGNNVDGDGCSATCEAECGCWNGGPDAFMGAASLTELFASTASMFSVATCNDLDECNETQARCEATDAVGDRTEIFVEVYDRGCEWRVRDDATGTDAEAAVSLTEAQGAACQRDLDALAETDTLMCGLSNPGGCGNGVLDPGEECDDGNDVNGDGCSATCEA